jgi:hypothetical protein
MTTTTLDMKVQDFLAQKRIAVAGVSRDKGHHPVGNVIYHRLKTTGHEVCGESTHADVRRVTVLPICSQSLVAWTGSSSTRDRQRHNGSYACNEAGVRRVRMHQSLENSTSVSSRGRRVLPSTRHQCDRRCVPDGVRRGP